MFVRSPLVRPCVCCACVGACVYARVSVCISVRVRVFVCSCVLSHLRVFTSALVCDDELPYVCVPV